MSKIKKSFFCQECGYESPKWLGRCTACGAWNTFVEEVVTKELSTKSLLPDSKNSKPVLIKDIALQENKKTTLHNQEMDRVLGGGLVMGSLILVGGEPGIGKSTLMLQIAQQSQLKTLYVSGEESVEQIKMRAERMNYTTDNCYLYGETNVETIIQQSIHLQPQLLIVDSIQTLTSERIESSAGSVSQVRESASLLLKYAKTYQIPVFLIGHITKDGGIAGPKVLEHIVDVVLQFEGDGQHLYRILRAVKNRFGSVAEIGIFEMCSTGLREVHNPSELLLSHHQEDLSGIAIAASIEGMRPLMIEIQALVSSAVYGMPQRSTTGFDIRRLNMLLAVLEKRVGFKLSAKDVFLNLAGGIKVTDPAIDLSVVVAILSSNLDVPVPKNVAFVGEVGLSGEIRSVSRMEQRIAEAKKLGFTKIFIAKQRIERQQKDIGIEVVEITRVHQVMKALFQVKS